MAGKAILLKIGYCSICLGGTERAICVIRLPMRVTVVSGSGFGYASKCNNISISHFTLNYIHKGWMSRLFIQGRKHFHQLGGH